MSTDDVQVVVTREAPLGKATVGAGVATITIPKPSMTVNPESGRPGSTVTIEGSGFTGRVDGPDLLRRSGSSPRRQPTPLAYSNEQVVIPIDFDVAVDETSKSGATTVHDDRVPAWADKSEDLLAEHDVPAGKLLVRSLREARQVPR